MSGKKYVLKITKQNKTNTVNARHVSYGHRNQLIELPMSKPINMNNRVNKVALDYNLI